jgi:hypothetical protein
MTYTSLNRGDAKTRRKIIFNGVEETLRSSIFTITQKKLCGRTLRLSAFAVLFSFGIFAQNIRNNPTSNHANKFEQLGTILPDANVYRSASGAPGHKYWQQKADYDIDATLDEKNLTLNGSEWVTYYNNSPDKLTYLW